MSDDWVMLLTCTELLFMVFKNKIGNQVFSKCDIEPFSNVEVSQINNILENVKFHPESRMYKSKIGCSKDVTSYMASWSSKFGVKLIDRFWNDWMM